MEILENTIWCDPLLVWIHVPPGFGCEACQLSELSVYVQDYFTDLKGRLSFGVKIVERWDLAGNICQAAEVSLRYELRTYEDWPIRWEWIHFGGHRETEHAARQPVHIACCLPK
jgi:hypothetical protein